MPLDATTGHVRPVFPSTPHAPAAVLPKQHNPRQVCGRVAGTISVLQEAEAPVCSAPLPHRWPWLAVRPNRPRDGSGRDRAVPGRVDGSGSVPVRPVRVLCRTRAMPASATLCRATVCGHCPQARSPACLNRCRRVCSRWPLRYSRFVLSPAAEAVGVRELAARRVINQTNSIDRSR